MIYVAFLSMLFFGLHNFIYLMASRAGVNRARYLFFSYLTAALLGLTLLLSTHEITFQRAVALLAVFSALTKLVADFIKLKLFGEKGLIFTQPIIRTHYTLTAIMGLLLLNESLSYGQLLGVMLSFLVVMIISAENNHGSMITRSVLLAFVAAFLTAISSFAAKLGAMSGNVLLFVSLAFLTNATGSFALSKSSGKNTGQSGKEMKYGVVTGAVHFIAFLSAMLALEHVEAAIVFPIISLGFVVSAFLAVAVCGERITPMKGTAAVLSIVAGWLLAG